MLFAKYGLGNLPGITLQVLDKGSLQLFYHLRISFDYHRLCMMEKVAILVDRMAAVKFNVRNAAYLTS